MLVQVAGLTVPPFPQALSSGYREGPRPGWGGRVGPVRLQWPVSLVPLRQQAEEWARQVFMRRQGGQEEGRKEVDRLRGRYIAF